MDKRPGIGIPLFFDNHSNSGIVNYIYNIIAALNTLPDERKPVVVLYHAHKAPVDYIRSIGYPHIIFRLANPNASGRLARGLNKLFRSVTGIDFYCKYVFFREIQTLYPYFPFNNEGLDFAPNKIQWLVDFNNRAYPDFFADRGEALSAYQRELVKTTQKIVLSSESLRDELQRYYPGYRNEVKILRFACSLPVLKESDYAGIRAKYGLSGHYLISPNQFWEHKNQATVIESLRILTSRAPDLDFEIVFTGSMSVNRGKGKYAERLLEKIEASGLSGRVKMLGVIDRYDQLVLMKNAYSILQPSLYEGWSTLVEEAKALNKHILVSDIPVHREQLTENCTFFSPLDAEELADKIIGIFKHPPVVGRNDYQDNIRQFADDILAVLLPSTQD